MLSIVIHLLSVCLLYQAHFVEMDPWVISEVLKPNLECTGFLGISHIHMYRVENFLAMAEKSKGRTPLSKHTLLYTDIKVTVVSGEI
jgi:hypothetical protein